MKKRILLILFMFLTTFVLAGCDWFGTQTLPTDTTTTTTTVEDSTSTTTTTTTSGTNTTTTTTTAVPGTATISFEENGGSTVANITQTVGSSVTAPVAPSKTGYTFIGWYSNISLTMPYTFTVMPSTGVTLYAKWQALTYTVNFYDADGVLIESQTIEFGQGATPPDAPYKVGFVFSGWDAAFSNVTGNINVHAVYEGHYQLLVDMIISMSDGEPGPEEIDRTIEMLMFVSGMETEQATYLMMVEVMTMVQVLPTFTTLAEFQSWFAALSVQGYDQDRIVEMLVNAILMMIDQESKRYDEQKYLDNIAYFEEQLALANQQFTQVQSDISNYCDTLALSDAVTCHAYIAAELENTQLMNAYQNSLWGGVDELWGNDFDWGKYYDLEWNIQYYYDYLYYYEDPDTAAMYLADFNAMMDSLTTEELAMYEPLLDMYMAWQTYQHVTLQDLNQAMWPLYDNVKQRNVMEVIQNDYMNSFWDNYNQIGNYEWMIQEEYQWMVEDQVNHEMLVAMRDYLWSVEGTTKLTILAGTVYDVVESVIVGIDPATFNLIFDLVTGQVTPDTLPMTPTDISGYAHQVADLLTLLGSSIDATDTANLLSMGYDVVEILLQYSDMEAMEQTAILAIFELKGPQYIGIASDVYYELIDLLNGMTPEKVQLLMDTIPLLMQSNMEDDPYSIVINVAILIDAFLYDGTFDIELLVGHFVEVYYDVNTMFNADPLVTAAVKLAMVDAIHQIILVAHDVSLLNPEDLSVDDMMLMYELYSRGQRLVMLLQMGDLEGILDPYDYLDVHEMLVNLIDPYQEMDPGQADALIDVIVTTFGYETEAEVMFTIMSVMELQAFVESINSIEDVQELYTLMGTMGFDNATLAHMVATFLYEFSDYMVMYEYDPTYLDELQGYYDDAMVEYNFWNQELIDFFADFDYEKSLMTDPLLTDVESLWNTFIYNRQLENDFWNMLNSVKQMEPYYWMWNDYTYWYLDDLLNRYYQGVGGMMLPPEMQVTYQNYLDEFNMLSYDEQMMYGPVLNYAETNYNFHWTVYYPQMQNLQMSYMFPMYQTSLGLQIGMWFINNINTYNEITFQIGEYQRQMDMYLEQMSYGNKNEIWIHIDGFFDDPDNFGLLEDVALILIDEVGSLIMYPDTDSYNLVIGLMTGSVDPSTLDLSALGILGYLNSAEDFLVHLFSSMDETDKATVVTFLQKVAYQYVYSLGLPVLEADAIYLDISTAIQTYFYAIFDVKLIVTNFMGTLTELKIQEIMDSIEIINSLPYEYLPGEEAQELNDNFVRAIYIANIIDELLAGDSLDYDYLIALIINGYFDFAYGFNYTGTIVIEDLILELQTLIDDIVYQTSVVQAYADNIDPLTLQITYDDPLTLEIVEGLTEAEIAEIDALRILIEQLGSFLNNGPEGYVPTV